jgi:eukaryotic-like serine/threonine-protein kinase
MAEMVGQNIGKYRVLDRIGRGGMGTVYRAMDETLHREVAIKVLNAELNDPEVAKRFRAEAITVARLSHPGIATIYELFQHEGQWLMVMEFVRGETLEHMVDRMAALSPQRSAELCMQALAALAHAHSMGVVHRDLKPANMMITETGAVKIMDFGIARVAGTEHLTNAGFMMGTPAYMSPEQVRGEEIDARADLYSMGVVFYRLTTGKLPFKGDTPFAMAQSQVNDPPTPAGMVRPDLPPWVEPIVVRALTKKPEERFQSAAEFHEAFARCLAGLPFTTVYGAGSTAQTEILATPPRPLPTGSLSMRGPGTGSIPVSPPSGVTPGVNPPATASIAAAEMMTMAAGGRETNAPGPPSATGVKPQVVPATGKKDTKTKSDAIALGAIALVILGLVGGAAFWYRSRIARTPVEPPPASTPAQPAPGTTATIDPATPPATAAAPTDPAASSSGAAVPPATGSPTVPSSGAPGAVVPPGTPNAGAKSPATTPATPSAPGTATIVPGTTTPPGATTAGKAGSTPLPPGTVPATPGAKGGATVPVAGTTPTTPAPVATDPLVAFTNVKLYVVSGKRANDRDVLINFQNGQIAVLPKDGGEAMGTLPYGSIAKATYVKARDPKWDTSLPSPPEGLDVGSFLRQSRHWFVIQTGTGFTILRLEDNNASRLVDTFESRTGKPVDKPRTSDK